MKHLIRPLRRLQWKLTLSYALITTLSMLLVEILAIAVIFLSVNLYLPQIILSSLQQQALQTSSYFVHGAPDREALSAWLNIPNPYASGSYQSGFLTVIDRQGQVIASVGNEAVPSNIALQTRLSASGAADLHDVLIGQASSGGLVNRDANGTLVVIVPNIGKGYASSGSCNPAGWQFTASERVLDFFLRPLCYSAKCALHHHICRGFGDYFRLLDGS